MIVMDNVSTPCCKPRRVGGQFRIERQSIGQFLVTQKDGKCRVVTSIINLGEVAYITEREQGLRKAQAALGLIEQLPIEVQSASDEAVFRAAHIKANYPVAYADAFTISLAQTFEGTVLTGDPEFKSVEKIIQLEWLTE